MDWTYYAVLCLAWILGGFVSGVTSMGCALVAIPLLNLVMSPDRAILIGCIVGSTVPIAMVILYHKNILLRELFYLLLPCLPGCFFGVLIFKITPIPEMTLGLGIVLAIFVLWQMFAKGIPFRLRSYGFITILVGFTGGVINSLTSMPGTVMGSYASLRTWSKKNLLCMQSWYFLICACTTILIQWWQGLYTPSILLDAGLAIPGSILGVLLSIPFHRYINQERCRKLLLLVLGFSALLLLHQGINMMDARHHDSLGSQGTLYEAPSNSLGMVPPRMSA